MHKIRIPNASRKESCKAQMSRGFRFVQVLLWCFPARPTLSQDQSYPAARNPGCCNHLRLSPPGQTLCSPGMQSHGLHQQLLGQWQDRNWCLQRLRDLWTVPQAEQGQKAFSCLVLSNGVQDLPFHFCYSLKDFILFSFSSIFFNKYLSWKRPFWSGYNPNKAQTPNHQNFPHLWVLSGPLCSKHWASKPISPAHSKAHGGEGYQTSLCFACLRGFVVTHITSHPPTPLWLCRSSKSFWEITHMLLFWRICIVVSIPACHAGDRGGCQDQR